MLVATEQLGGSLISDPKNLPQGSHTSRCTGISQRALYIQIGHPPSNNKETPSVSSRLIHLIAKALSIWPWATRSTSLGLPLALG